MALALRLSGLDLGLEHSVIKSIPGTVEEYNTETLIILHVFLNYILELKDLFQVTGTTLVTKSTDKPILIFLEELLVVCIKSDEHFERLIYTVFNHNSTKTHIFFMLSLWF